MKVDMETLLSRARSVVKQAPGRAIIGVCGAPGSGKSTLAAGFAAAYGPSAVVVPMDGFHLDDVELRRLGLSDRKGAPTTFDTYGYISVLTRLRSETATTVYAPLFDRAREIAIAGAVGIRPEHRLVVTEGNYLLHDAPGWRDIASLLDDTWYVEENEQLRVERLVQRHIQHGKSPEEATRWVAESDQTNARIVNQTRASAKLVVDIEDDLWLA